MSYRHKFKKNPRKTDKNRMIKQAILLLLLSTLAACFNIHPTAYINSPGATVGAELPQGNDFSATADEEIESLITLPYTASSLAGSCSVSLLNHVSETTPCSCDSSGICTVGITGNTNFSGAASFQYSVTVNGRTSANSTVSLTVNNVVKPFITLWDTTRTSTGSSNAIQVRLPLTTDESPTYNFEVDWGDGTKSTITSATDPNRTHTYATSGIYEIKITGELGRLVFTGNTDKLKLLEIKQWGDIAWESMADAFRTCTNLQISAVDTPNLSQVTNMSGMLAFTNLNSDFGTWDTSSITDMSYTFYSASGTFLNIENWDTSKVTNMSHMFEAATTFDRNIGSWDTSSVINMSCMFQSANIFNQDIGNWNVSNVTNAQRMFNNARKFNQNINSWNTSKIQDMSFMFSSAVEFNQPLNGWNTSNVTDLSYIFNGAYIFNQPIGNWNTSKVTNMKYAFAQATKFNQNLSWDTSNVTDMEAMFSSTYEFQGQLINWNTSKVTNMRYMFSNSYYFNSDIGNWNTSQVTNMSSMFNRANAFNHDLNWDTSEVTDMKYMFERAWSFRGNITNWNTAKVTDMSYMFSQASTFNHDLSSWQVGAVTNYTDFDASASNWVLPRPNFP